MVIGILLWSTAWYTGVNTWMGDRISILISVGSPSDETLNRGFLALLLWRQYEFPFGINKVQFFFFIFSKQHLL